MMRATYSSRQAEPRRVLSARRFSAAAIPPQSVAALAQTTDFRQHRLFAGVRLDVLLIRAQAISEPDVAYPLALAPFVTEGVPGAFADGLPFPLRNGRHYVEQSLPAAVFVISADAADPLESELSIEPYRRLVFEPDVQRNSLESSAPVLVSSQ
jgi:hypothetical protein